MARAALNVPGTIILSRPDNLGDAVVTLPMAGWIKNHRSDTRIIALAKGYTRPVWARCRHIDEVLLLEELMALGDDAAAERLASTGAEALVHVFPHRAVARWAKAARIPRRIGTSHRWWHWTTCNERVHFSRKCSDLHEAQLNTALLAPFGIPMPSDVQDLVPFIGLRGTDAPEEARALLRPDRRNVVIHPLKGSGVEWGLEHFAELITALDPARFHCLITGTATEAERYRAVLPVGLPHVTDTGGRLPLDRLMDLIAVSDALVAASTGPLHIAAASGIRTVGLFSTRRPIHPGRWAPLGTDVHVLTDPREQDGDTIIRVAPERVLRLLDP